MLSFCIRKPVVVIDLKLLLKKLLFVCVYCAVMDNNYCKMQLNTSLTFKDACVNVYKQMTSRKHSALKLEIIIN